MRRFAVLTPISAAAFAQQQPRTYTFAHTADARHMQEVVNMIRALAEVQHVMIDAAQRTVTATGTPDQLTLITWLFTEVDRPAVRPASVQVRDTTFADPRTPAVKIFYPAHLATAQQVQEVINAMRSIGEIQRCIALNGPGAIVVRGSAQQVALAEWIVRELDGSMAGQRPKGVRENTFEDDLTPPSRRTPAVRIFYRASAGTAQDISRAGERPAPTAGGNQYHWAGSTIRAFYVSKRGDIPALIKQVRDIGIQRAVPYSRQHAIVFRGLPAQLAAAEPLLR